MSAGDNRAHVRTVAILAIMPNELLVVHAKRWIMAARKWTDEQRARQAALIHGWQPWKHSTGARTPEGKAVASRNAFRFTIRKAWLFGCWLLKESRKCRAGLPCASIDEINIMEARRGFVVNRTQAKR